MNKKFLFIAGLLLAMGYSLTGVLHAQTFPLTCPDKTFMRAKDSGGAFKFLRSPVEQDGLGVLKILQEEGPLPRDNGEALVRGVDSGTVQPYHGPGFTLWYFQSDVGLPAKLPWVDAQGACMGSSPVVVSEEIKGWVYVKVPHWARLNVPTDLLLKGQVCARARDFPTVHEVRQTAGSFKGMPGVVCGVPGRIQEIVSAGFDGVLFVFVTSSTQLATGR